MIAKNFQELIVWEKAHKLVLKIYNVTNKFPGDEKFGLVSQIRRSAVSICANIAEGYKKSTKDFVRYLDIAQGSLEETKYHLILSKDLHHLTRDEYKNLFNATEEIGRILEVLARKLRFKIKLR